VGTVAAVALHLDHHFSKSVQTGITLVEGHGVEGDVHAGLCVKHRYLARRQPRLPNLRQVHLLPEEFSFPFEKMVMTSVQGSLAKTSRPADLNSKACH
jgi:hypothetical protein